MAGYAIYKKNRELCCVYSILFGIWITLLLATPVYAEFRYYYSVVASLPLIVFLPFVKEEN